MIYVNVAAVWQAVGHWIFDFQTLITGFLAIIAAWYAAAPAWGQLKDSNLQTRIMHRETLAVLLRETEERAIRVAKSIDEPLSWVSGMTRDPAGDPIKISDEHAFYAEQKLAGCLDWYLVTFAGTEDARVEQAKVSLRDALDTLVNTLNDVHWPVHNDQSGENYSFTDEQWIEINRKSDEAEILVAERVNSALIANCALKDAQKAVISELRQKISLLNNEIGNIK